MSDEQPTVEAGPPPVGDMLGEVNVRFSIEALRVFIDCLNASYVGAPAHPGYRLLFSVDEYEPGRAMLTDLLVESPDPVVPLLEALRRIATGEHTRSGDVLGATYEEIHQVSLARAALAVYESLHPQVGAQGE